MHDLVRLEQIPPGALTMAEIDSTFAMLAGMAGSAIETIEDLAGYTVDDAKAWMEPKPEMVEQLKQVIRSRQA